jgi:hypothetical protein
VLREQIVLLAVSSSQFFVSQVKQVFEGRIKMVVRLLTDCLCVVSICTLLWGVSPLFADCDCVGPPLTEACETYQDTEGKCTSDGANKPCMEGRSECTCRTKQQSLLHSCVCRRSGSI